MKAKVYRSVSNWPRDIIFKLEYLHYYRKKNIFLKMLKWSVVWAGWRP
jgi:hypothetical protein